MTKCVCSFISILKKSIKEKSLKKNLLIFKNLEQNLLRLERENNENEKSDLKMLLNYQNNKYNTFIKIS